ncbi:hypothetical protein EON65_36965 [archaeon]|nr:MAG: hypothetical protein EON65_36965 [archaeon]
MAGSLVCSLKKKRRRLRGFQAGKRIASWKEVVEKISMRHCAKRWQVGALGIPMELPTYW